MTEKTRDPEASKDQLLRLGFKMPTDKEAEKILAELPWRKKAKPASA